MKRSEIFQIIHKYFVDYGACEPEDKQPTGYLLDELEEAGMLPPRIEITKDTDPNKHVYVHKWESEDEEEAKKA